MNYRLLLILSLVTLSGCAHQTNTPLPRASYCETDELTVITACTDSHTDTIETADTEAKTIHRCSNALKEMRQTLAQCHRSTDEYNRMIDEINQQNLQQPWWLRLKQAFLKLNTESNIHKGQL